MSSALSRPKEHVRTSSAYPARQDVATVADAGIPAKGLAAAIVLSFCLVAVLMARAGLTIRLEPSLAGFLLLYAAASASAMCLPRVAWSAPAQACSDGAEYVTLFAGVCIAGALASYPIAASSHGFSDVRMEDFDRAVRFDWLFWYELVAHHPVLQLFERAAYQGIFVIPAVILAHFAATGGRSAAMHFITSFWLSAIMTLGAFYLVPMQGPFALLLHGHAPYMPISALYQAQIIPELRTYQLRDVDLEALRGLVGAPSFHATSAILFMAAAWPSRLLRWPVIALCCAMLLATPVEGTHYLGDVLAGVLIAFLGLAATSVIQRRAFRRSGAAAQLSAASSPRAVLRRPPSTRAVSSG